MEGKINVVFKKVLIAFIKENMNSCSSVVRAIEKSETYNDLNNNLTMYGEEIAESLGVDLDEECNDCCKKDCIISELEDELHEKSFTPKSLDDEYKLEAFIRNKDNFSVSDFESLLD